MKHFSSGRKLQLLCGMLRRTDTCTCTVKKSLKGQTRDLENKYTSHEEFKGQTRDLEDRYTCYEEPKGQTTDLEDRYTYDEELT